MPQDLKKYPNLFDLHLPTKKCHGIISIPHSGELIPAPFLPYLTTDQKALATDVDTAVYDLIDIKRLNREGIVIIVSKIHRCAIDLNRTEKEAPLNWKENTLGVPLVTKSVEESQLAAWTKEYYAPYFETLKGAIQLCRAEKKRVSLIDLHSMPSKPTPFHLKKNPDQKIDRPDFCLSDLQGKSAPPSFINFINLYLKEHGYKPRNNDPYLGGYITQHFATVPEMSVLQIEINRRLYLDEETKIIKASEAAQLKHTLTDLFIHLFKKF